MAHGDGRTARRAALEGALLARFRGGPGADRRRLRHGAARSGRPLHAAGRAAPPRPRRHAAGLSAAVRRLPAGPDPRGREAPVPARRQVLGPGAPARQRHARRRAALRRLPRLGRRRPHLGEAPSGRADARGAGGAAGRGQRRDRADRRPASSTPCSSSGRTAGSSASRRSADRATPAPRIPCRRRSRCGPDLGSRWRRFASAAPCTRRCSTIAARSTRSAMRSRRRRTRARRRASSSPSSRARRSSLPAATCRSTTAPKRSRSVPRSAS